MKWNLPGTVLTVERADVDAVESLFSPMFLAGGMVLSQVASITGLEPYTVQNWVKRGFLPPPVRKRYSLNQLCRIININMLKGALPMEQICALLGYINGHLDDASDDMIDDAALYFLFVRLEAQADGEEAQAIDRALESYVEPAPGARARVKQVLAIMLAASAATRKRQEAESLLAELNRNA